MLLCGAETLNQRHVAQEMSLARQNTMISHFVTCLALSLNLARVGSQSLLENNRVLWDFTVNPSALRAADLMGLCLDSAERDCSFSFNREQRRDCVSPDKINFVVLENQLCKVHKNAALLNT